MGRPVLRNHVRPPWGPTLQASLEQNRTDPVSSYLQLATVRADGSPANRTVVFRGFGEAPTTLLMVSDARSEKQQELQRDPRVELAWYFPLSREQYRISGTVTLNTDPDCSTRRAAWQALSPSAQEQYSGPAPGCPLEEAAATVTGKRVPSPAPTAADPPAWFLLLALAAERVERLELRPTPHRRERYLLAQSGWERVALTP